MKNEINMSLVVLSIVALVAIVGLVGVIGIGPNSQSSGNDGGLAVANSNAGGLAVSRSRDVVASKDVAVKSKFIVKSSKFSSNLEQGNYFNREVTSSKDLGSSVKKIKSDSSLVKTESIINKNNVAKFVSSKGLSKKSLSRSNTIVFTQAWADLASYGGGYTFDLDSSWRVILSSDIYMGDSVLNLVNGVVLDCQGHELIGSGEWGIIARNNVEVKNCVVSGRDTGFASFDNSIIRNSVAKNNIIHGFFAADSSRLYNSLAESTVSLIQPRSGFFIVDSAQGYGLTAKNNYYGFIGDGKIFNSVSNNNHGFGALISGKGHVDGLTVTNCERGVFLKDLSSIVNSVANNNNNYGFKLSDSSTGKNLISERTNGYGIYVDSSAKLETGIQSCYNSVVDIFMNYGLVVGNYKTTTGLINGLAAGGSSATVSVCPPNPYSVGVGTGPTDTGMD